MTKILIADLKSETGVGFGTSGIRDLATNLSDKVVYVYTQAFINRLREVDDLKERIAIAGDRRESTDRIMRAVYRACVDNKIEVVNCGLVPTPAVSYFAMINQIPSIMVTGSHIPGDRNGVKFNLSFREILKSDEVAIAGSEVEIDESLINREVDLPVVNNEAKENYIKRYTDFFPNAILANKKIGLYGHSAVGRDIFAEIMEKLGASVTKIDYSEIFVPIDTEAVNEELVIKVQGWHKEFGLDYVVSTDGDGDRPLLTDEEGNYIRADLMPIIGAKYLGVEAIATTLTANTVVDMSGFFKKVERTKVGSPYIVEAMIKLANDGYAPVAGYESNGGFLLESDIGVLKRLPTRDAILVILCVLAESVKANVSVMDLFSRLPDRSTYSLSIKGIPTDKSLKMLEEWKKYQADIEATFGKISEINSLDGLRLTFENGEIVHFRPSKNAPEFRNYTEAENYDRARILSELAIQLIKKWLE